MLSALDWAAVHQPQTIQQLKTVASGFLPGSMSFLWDLSAQTSLGTAMLFGMNYAAHTKALVDGFQARLTVEPVGRLHLERLDMFPAGIERGELVYSVPMTPLETVNIAHKEWSTTTEEFDRIVTDSFEEYSEVGVAEKNDISQSTNSETKHSTTLDLNASLTATYGMVTLSTSGGYKSASDDSQSQKDSRNHSIEVTRKASARTRKDHKTSFHVASVAGTENQSVRVLTNPSPTDSLRVDYFQMMRKWRVQLYRYGLRMTYDVVIPNPGADLRKKIDQLRQIDEELNTPFQFPVTLTDITPDSYQNLQSQWGGAVDHPPKPTEPAQATDMLHPPQDSDRANFTFGKIAVDIKEGYHVKENGATIQFTAVHHPEDQFSFGVVGGQRYIGYSDSSLLLPNWNGKSGHLELVYYYNFIVQGGAILLDVPADVDQETISAWQTKALDTMHQAAQDAYDAKRNILSNQRAALVLELSQFDALTLRQMEREEITKGVLRWLFGPSFSLMPAAIQKVFVSMAQKNGNLDKMDVSALTSEQWEYMMEFGEFVKFLQTAIEWENMLFFLYPYYWGPPSEWDNLRFLDHPDALHRRFLRSGAARVVLSIRPGFEESFTALVDSGSFTQLNPNHPYVTIAQEIEAYAKTHYDGIPPANPDGTSNDTLTEGVEKGELIAEWFEYTPTSALDIALNSGYPQMG